MASEQAVAEVLAHLPDDDAWTSEQAGQALDTFAGNVSRAVRSFWAKRAANTADLVDISESGSSRSLSTKHKNAVEQVAYWDKIIADETAAALEIVGSVSRRMRRG